MAPQHQNVPVRNLGQLGIVRDQGSYDLPLNAFTGGANVRFADGAVRDAPIWRRAAELPSAIQPTYALGVRGTQAFDEIFITTAQGRVHRFIDRSLTDVSPTALVETASEEPWTGSVLGSVVYLNRPTGVPLRRLPTGTAFAALENWDASWRCASLRPFRDFLVALNVRKGATAYPNMVKWSNLALQGQVPNSWDSTNTANNVAGENPLPDATAPIIDGGALRDAFLIYTGRETYLMRYVQGQFVFDFQKISGNGGILNANCWAEVDGRHYVFGPNTIYVTDGTQQQSISDGRVTSEIYNTMNKQLARRFFVHHNPALTEVMFCFVSGSSDAHFRNPLRCNRAAVYNYSNNTWAFRDLPNVAFITSGNLDSKRTFDELTMTWEQLGGTWYDMEHSSLSHPVAVTVAYSDAGTGRAITSGRVLAYDFLDEGNLTYPLDAECHAPAYVERVNMDLDELQLPLNTQKAVANLMPQVATSRGVPFVVQIGAGLYPDSRTYEVAVQFQPGTAYKVDSRAAGRYLNTRFSIAEPAGFKFSGYDMKVFAKARR